MAGRALRATAPLAAALVFICVFIGCTDEEIPSHDRAEPAASRSADSTRAAAPSTEAAASGAGPCPSIGRIEVWKASHTLRAYCTDGEVLTVPVALGLAPEGTKLRSGDRRTPEGGYAIAGRPRSSRFRLFIPLDYPSVADAALALQQGRVDATSYEQIVEAHEQDRLPPQDTPLGGYIGLHGEGPSRAGDSAHADWTFGCIAVSDRDIERIADRVEVGVPVWIHP